MSIVLVMIFCFGGFSFITTIPVRNIPDQSLYNFSKSDGACDDTLLTVNKRFEFFQYPELSMNLY